MIMDNIVSVNIGQEDLNELNILSNLATTDQNTFIVLLNGSADDVFDNTVQQPSDAVEVANITTDSTPPQLESYTLDLGTEVLSLTFSEVIDVNSIYLPGLTITNEASMNPAVSYSLTTSSSVVSSSGDVIEIHLIGDDASALKANEDLATSISNTFISLSESFAQDVFGNNITSIPSIMALSTTLVVPDNTTVTLLSFTRNLSTGTITLRFSEATNVSTFMMDQLCLSSISDGSGLTLVSTTEVILPEIQQC